MAVCAAFARAWFEVMTEAWRPRMVIGPAEWAETYRVLPARDNAEPGPYRLARTPYLREVHDVLGDPDVRKVVVVAPAQCGKSEAGRNWLGWIVDMAPGPVMIVFPTEASAKENMDERVIPMFGDCPQLAHLLTGRAWDVKRGKVYLTSCSIYVGWAGSYQALATRPIQYVFLDEVDKYPGYRGKEADPLSLAEVRTKSYGHRGKVYVVSTPTIPSGPIMRAYDSCVDRRRLHVPCLSCGEFALFEWEHVTWDGRDLDDEESLRCQQVAFGAGRLVARYRCPSCGHEHGDDARWRMVEAARYVSEGSRGSSVGFMIPGLASPWTSFSGLASDYVTARLKGIEAIHHFYNNILGLPFWAGGEAGDEHVAIDPKVVWAKSSRGRPRGELPPWAVVLIASADPGKREIHWGLRAWGRGYQSALIDCGVAASFEELLDRTLRASFGGSSLAPRLLTIDVGGGKGVETGSRTDEIYRFAKIDPARIKPLKGLGGAGRALNPIVTRTHTYRPPGRKSQPYDVTLSVIDTQFFKDLTAARVLDEDREKWQVFRGVDGDYVRQVTAERKILIERRVRPGGDVEEVHRWVPRVPGAANHFWDVEVYNTVGAYMLDLDRAISAEQARRRRRYRSGGGGDGWTIGRG